MFVKIKNLFREFSNISPWENCCLSKKEKGFKKNIILLIKKLYLWGQKTNLVRYYQIVKIIKNSAPESRILEVGSGPLGITRYVKRKVFGSDLKVFGPRYANMFLAQANANKLPYKDNSFDFVICVDMLEHVPKDSRQNVLNELLRVCKGQVFLGVPCKENAEVWEDKAQAVYNLELSKLDKNPKRKAAFIRRNKFLSEHSICGLPTEEEIKTHIYNCNVNIKLDIIENESVLVWYYGVLGDMKYNYFRWIVTAFCFVAFFELLCRAKWGGHYRKIFKIKKVDVL